MRDTEKYFSAVPRLKKLADFCERATAITDVVYKEYIHLLKIIT
jgi:hypothetical protein